MSVADCLHEVSNKTARVAFPPTSQQSKAARQRRATAQRSRLWKASMDTIAEEGEGEFGVAGEGKEEGGRGLRLG